MCSRQRIDLPRVRLPQGSLFLLGQPQTYHLEMIVVRRIFTCLSHALWFTVHPLLQGLPLSAMADM